MSNGVDCQWTYKLFDAMERGDITPQAIADMALVYMSEEQIKDMCAMNNILQPHLDLEVAA